MPCKSPKKVPPKSRMHPLFSFRLYHTMKCLKRPRKKDRWWSEPALFPCFWVVGVQFCASKRGAAIWMPRWVKRMRNYHCKGTKNETVSVSTHHIHYSMAIRFMSYHCLSCKSLMKHCRSRYRNRYRNRIRIRYRIRVSHECIYFSQENKGIHSGWNSP